jgi:hypothetical protein
VHKYLTKTLILSLLVATMLLSTSCMNHDPRCVNLMGNGRYCLQPTTAITPFNIQQKVEASIKNHNEIMVTEIEVNAESMQLIGLTPFGHQLVHISYNNEKAKAVVSRDSRLDPTLIIAMIQLALWPVDSVRKGLGEPLLLEETNGHRHYLAKDKLVLDVSYANAMAPANKLNLSFPTVGLILDIESLPEIERVQ